MGVQIFWYANIDHNSKSHIALTEHTTTFCKMLSINVKNSIKIKSKIYSMRNLRQGPLQTGHHTFSSV